MRPLAAALLVLLPACAGPIPVYLTTSDAAGPVTDPSPRVRETLDGGFGWWGLEYELVGPDAWQRSYGAIDLAILELEPGVAYDGQAFRPAPCRPSVWVRPDALDLAHELGHVFDLEHVDDPDNLMHSAGGGPEPELTDAQERDAEQAIGWFLACADGA